MCFSSLVLYLGTVFEIRYVLSTFALGVKNGVWCKRKLSFVQNGRSNFQIYHDVGSYIRWYALARSTNWFLALNWNFICKCIWLPIYSIISWISKFVVRDLKVWLFCSVAVYYVCQMLSCLSVFNLRFLLNYYNHIIISIKTDWWRQIKQYAAGRDTQVSFSIMYLYLFQSKI